MREWGISWICIGFVYFIYSWALIQVWDWRNDDVVLFMWFFNLSYYGGEEFEERNGWYEFPSAIYYDVWEMQIATPTLQYCKFYYKAWFSWHELEARVFWILGLRLSIFGI